MKHITVQVCHCALSPTCMGILGLFFLSLLFLRIQGNASLAARPKVHWNRLGLRKLCSKSSSCRSSYYQQTSAFVSTA